MKQKRYLPLLILVGVVVVLGILLALLSGLEEEEETSVPLFDLSADEVTGLAYVDADSEVTLLKDDDAWTMSQDPMLPLDTDTVDTMVSNIAELSALRDLGEETATDDMGFDEPTMVICLATDDMEPITETSVDGTDDETATAETATAETAVPDGVYLVTVGALNDITDAYYAKAEWNGHVYTIASADLSSLLKTPRQLYASQDITDLESDDITLMTLETPTETLSFTQSDGVWTLTDDPEYTLDQDAVEKMAATICALTTEYTITTPEADSVYGLDAPDAIVSVQAADGTTLTCTFGAVTEADDSLCYLRSSHTAGVVYEVNADHLAAFAQSKETLKGEEEATAESADAE